MTIPQNSTTSGNKTIEVELTQVDKITSPTPYGPYFHHPEVIEKIKSNGQELDLMLDSLYMP